MSEENEKDEEKVIIVADNQEFCCNREQLSQCSPYFYAMFNGSFVEKNKNFINIYGVTADAFENIVNLLKDITSPVEYDDLLSLLQGACMLQFDNIKQYCIDRLTDSLRLEYVFKIWEVTEQLDIHPLCEKAKCRAFLEFNQLRETQAVLNLDIKQLHSYLSSTFLHCDTELEVFETGMRWWYEFSQKFDNKEDVSSIATTYLRIILSCVDYNAISKSDLSTMMAYPDVPENSTISNLLRAVMNIFEKTEDLTPKNLEREAKELLTCKRRLKALLPCVVALKLDVLPKRKFVLSCSSMFCISIMCFDENKMRLNDIYSGHIHLRSCISTLIGYQILPYKDNLLLLGGEYQYGTSNWNENVWIYTLKERWEMLTKMPKERRHFSSFIVNDKLFIFGGTGKFRILYLNDICVYDFVTGKWQLNIKCPISLLDAKFCEYGKHILILNGNLVNSLGYLLHSENLTFLPLKFSDPSKLVTTFPKQFILFAHCNKIYIKGDYLIQMEVKGGSYFEIQSCSKEPPLLGDKIGFYKHNDKLYIFSKFCNFSDNILSLHKYHIESRALELLIQINDPVDTDWLIGSGCFGYLHYSLTKDNSTISTLNDF